MTTATIVMLVILGIALAVIAIVAVGMQGNLSKKAPDLADAMARTARHLNGDAQPPQGLVEFFEEIPMPGSAASAPEKRRR